jgi:hypothetical protein
MTHCSCFHRCCRQNLGPGLREKKMEPECRTENCFSTNQMVHFLFAWNHQHYQSCLKPVNRSTLGCGLFHCFEERCLMELDSRQMVCF